MITQDRLKELFDYNNGKLIRKIGVKGSSKGTIIGTVKPIGYRVATVDNNQYRVHKLIWLYHHGYLPNELDHINRERDDNRIENLRECTHQQNLGNSKARTGRYKGVSLCKQTQKWKAQISINGTTQNLGRYHTPGEAALVYNEKAKENFGEFAYLNEVYHD